MIEKTFIYYFLIFIEYCFLSKNDAVIEIQVCLNK